MASREPKPLPQRRNALATRRRLLEAGRAAFSRKGLQATSLRSDVLDPAGVSVGSFYHQFRDKTDLMLAVLEEFSEYFRAREAEALRPTPGRGLADIARAAYRLMFEIAEEQSEGAYIQLRERASADPRVEAFLRHDRERWVERLEASYRQLVDPRAQPLDLRALAELVVFLSFGALEAYLALTPEERPAQRQRLERNLVLFTLGGMAAFAGLIDETEEATLAGPRH